MVNQHNEKGLNCLIKQAQIAREKSRYPEYCVIVNAIGEAGGLAAVNFLIGQIEGAKPCVYDALMTALGRASRFSG